MRNRLATAFHTTRFGPVEIDDDRVIHFSRGLLGYPQFMRYALMPTAEENYFFWLQCVDDPELAFVILDPSIFVNEYRAMITDDVRAELTLEDDNHLMTFVIANQIDGQLTGNLLLPIVVNAANMRAMQFSMTGSEWTARWPLNAPSE